MNTPGLQLEMNFDKQGNRFRDCIEGGIFSLLIEHDAPDLNTSPVAAAETLLKLENAVMSINEIPAALAITERQRFLNSYRSIDYAMALNQTNRDRHLLYVSGRDSDDKELERICKLASANNFCNLAAVSGNAFPGENVKNGSKHFFTDSVNILHDNMGGKRIYPGCVVNPNKVAPYPMLAQMFKLVKKINFNAKFAVVQTNWDMAKLQALRWYLFSRNYNVPLIARLFLLTPELIDQIQAGKIPGVAFPFEMHSYLKQELSVSRNQFDAAQWRRLELQAAGCHFLGYSAIQLAGADTPDRARIAAKRIARALNEFTSFEHWVDEYKSYLAQSESSPYSGGYYFFEDLLKSQQLPPNPVRKSLKLPPLSNGKLRHFKLAHALFSRADDKPASRNWLLKRLLTSCRKCKKCQLPNNFYICPYTCPKQMLNGPCGGCSPDGRCEININNQCVFNQVAELANYFNAGHILEDKYLTKE